MLARWGLESYFWDFQSRVLQFLQHSLQAVDATCQGGPPTSHRADKKQASVKAGRARDPWETSSNVEPTT